MDTIEIILAVIIIYGIGVLTGFQLEDLYECRNRRIVQEQHKKELSEERKHADALSDKLDKALKYNTLREKFDTLDIDLYSNGTSVINSDGDDIFVMEKTVIAQHCAPYMIVYKAKVNDNLVTTGEQFKELESIAEGYSNEIAKWIENNR